MIMIVNSTSLNEPEVVFFQPVMTKMEYIIDQALDYYNNFQTGSKLPSDVSSVVNEIYQYFISVMKWKYETFYHFYRAPNRYFIIRLGRVIMITIMVLMHPNVYFSLPDMLKYDPQIKCSFEKTIVSRQFRNYKDYDCMFNFIK